jgi:hypothetical protein
MDIQNMLSVGGRQDGWYLVGVLVLTLERFLVHDLAAPAGMCGTSAQPAEHQPLHRPALSENADSLL